ncbi:MAG: C4-dicarboxylate ABC transporter permease [Hyphomicrobiales bacterium]|nr:MAG: C4-dicarboxylate ABC transporter permease [Hyphomicrobiales bacterium]
MNRWVERACVFLLVILTLDVWLGILARYAIPYPLTFTEELARYLMIWMALLAVSCGISRREHIGVLLLFERFPPTVRKWLAIGIDVIAFVFFAFLFVYGIGFAERGFSRLTMIYDIPKGYPFLVVPIAALLCCIQLALVAAHDFFSADGVTAADRVDI